MLTQEYQFTCPKFTVYVKVSSKGIILDTAPVTQRFVGCHYRYLTQWFKRFGHTQMFRLWVSEKVLNV